ncbi:VLRF1 family aeRF1-type release factor [Staphylococcus equorum]|uniref:VLRF1 family aeRF1-type release factor n=1 Tax=Staphylococcus equorum TaxID=246432 RepID=UPI003D80745B
MLLQEEINNLEQFDGKSRNQKVFSIYLDTSPDQGTKWKIELKNALKDLSDKTKSSDNHEEKNQAKDIINKVETEIQGAEPNLKRGLILFMTADETLKFEKHVNISIKTEFKWDTKPKLDQLKSLQQSYPYTGVLVLQQDKARVIETEIGTIVDEDYYTLDLDTNDWREHSGPQGDDLTQGGAQRDEYKERVKANQERWFKSLVATIEKNAKKKGWHQLYLAGEKEEVEKLKTMFNRNIDQVTPSNILNLNASEIINKVMEE